MTDEKAQEVYNAWQTSGPAEVNAKLSELAAIDPDRAAENAFKTAATDFARGAEGVESKAAESASQAAEKITLYHGSVDNYNTILEQGLDPLKTPTWVTTNREAAENAIDSGRVLSPGQGLDTGIVESHVPAETFNNLVEQGKISETRSWPGFGGRQIQG